MKKIAISILFLLFFASFTTSLFAIEFPKYTGYVNDFENILNNDEVLEQKLASLEKETAIEIAIVTVSDFAGTTIEDYALKLFETWKIGKADKDNGLLILISSAMRQSRFEVGYGLEGTLPDSLTGRIQDYYMIPAFKTDDYSKGVLDGIDATIGVIKADPTILTTLEDDRSQSNISETVVILLFFAFYILSFTKSWWMGGVVGALFGFYISFMTPNVLDIFYLPLFYGGLGLFVDYIVSKTFIGTMFRNSNRLGGFSSGSGRSSGGMSFGGGSSGGGGSSRSW